MSTKLLVRWVRRSSAAARAGGGAALRPKKPRTALAVANAHRTFWHFHKTETHTEHPALLQETTHHGAGELEAQRLLLSPSRLPLFTGAIRLP